MRKLVRVAVWIVAGVLVLAGGAAAWFAVAYPKAEDPPEVAVEPTPELLDRGEYLFRHVAVCADCHGVHREEMPGFPLREGSVGAGGNAFPLGGESVVYARNITPTAIGEWSDGEVIRALRDGIARDGTPLFPIMPYTNYRHLSERDLHAVVAYARTLEALPDTVPGRRLDFPLNVLIRIMPSPGGPVPETAPDPADPVAYGEYLATVASCGDCHTPRDDRGRPLPGMTLAGGSEFPIGDAVVRSANITPHDQTGIGGWTKERFVAEFRNRAAEGARPRPWAEGEVRSPMSWIAYGGMTEEDLGAIWAYLRTVEPVEHDVVPRAPVPAAGAEGTGR